MKCTRCGKDNPADIHTCSPQPVAWGMPRSNGEIIDCISPSEHRREEGSYTVPLFTYPPDDTEVQQLREQNTLLDIELAKSEALLHQCFEVLTGPTCHQSTQWAQLVETLAERLK